MDDSAVGEIVSAIRSARISLRWRPGKAQAHLDKRIALGHLPAHATLSDYERLIQRILSASMAEVWLYTFDNAAYPAVVYSVAGRPWLVMLNMAGDMETAFLVEAPHVYFADPRFQRLGTLQELEL